MNDLTTFSHMAVIGDSSPCKISRIDNDSQQHKCEWCGGWTNNLHCEHCGGPKSDNNVVSNMLLVSSNLTREQISEAFRGR